MKGSQEKEITRETDAKRSLVKEMGCQDKKCHDTATAVKVVKREKCVRCRASELSRRSKRSQGKTLSREIETSEKDLRESGGSESCREKGISS